MPAHYSRLQKAATEYRNGYPVMEPMPEPVATQVIPPQPKIPKMPPLPANKVTRVTPAAFYDAIQAAETGSQQDPWIRTKYAPKAGSTSFGPVTAYRNKGS